MPHSNSDENKLPVFHVWENLGTCACLLVEVQFGGAGWGLLHERRANEMVAPIACQQWRVSASQVPKRLQALFKL